MIDCYKVQYEITQIEIPVTPSATLVSSLTMPVRTQLWLVTLAPLQNRKLMLPVGMVHSREQLPPVDNTFYSGHSSIITMAVMAVDLYTWKSPVNPLERAESSSPVAGYHDQPNRHSLLSRME